MMSTLRWDSYTHTSCVNLSILCLLTLKIATLKSMNMYKAGSGVLWQESKGRACPATYTRTVKVET